MLKSTVHKKHHLQLETLSPIHIGTGKTVNKQELEQFAAGSAALIDLDSYIEKQLEGIKDVNLMKEKIEELTRVFSDPNQGLPEQTLPVLRKINSPLGDFEEFREHIHLKLNHHHDIYIPGSSLKGAIKTLLFTQKLFLQQRDKITTRQDSYNKKQFKYAYKHVMQQILGWDANSDIGRLFQIADTVFSNTATEINKCVTANWLNYKWDRKKERGGSLDNWIECLPKGMTAKTTITFPEVLHAQLMNQLQKERNSPLRKNYEHLAKSGYDIESLNTFFRIINKETKALIKMEKRFLADKYQKSPYTQTYYSRLETLENQLNQAKDYCILRMGFGSGFRFITGYWQENKMNRGEAERLAKAVRGPYYKNYDFPKTLKMLENGEPLGFIKLSKSI